jgi:putative ABC transport system ATP-binding protein
MADRRDNGAGSLLVEELTFAYRGGEFRLSIPELTVAGGERLAVIGPSGSGKTTFLHLVAGIVRPATGRIRVGETDVHSLGESDRRNFRARRLGLVFQEFELLDYLDVRENILLPYHISPALALTAEARERADALAGRVGLGDKLRRSVRKLSQGERQRVAVCRALVADPDLLLADEPTGNLDPDNKDLVLEEIFEFAQERGITLLAVTHDHGLLDRFERVVDAADWIGANGGAS